MRENRKLVLLVSIFVLVCICLCVLGPLSGTTNYRVEGESMSPKLNNGQFILASALPYYLGPPQRDEIVVFRYPPNPSKNLIKRIVGLPGEKVEVKKGQVFVNDSPLVPSYETSQADYNWGPVVTGPDEYFVLGDNRAASSDSHSWGMLPTQNILGKAWFSYWPSQDWGWVQ